MFTYTHTYAQKTIKFTVDMLGGEKLYVDDELISKSNKWTFHNTHAFSIDGQALELHIKVVSMLKGEIEVSILENQQVIFNETQVFEGPGDEPKPSFNQEELRWKKEIEFPNDILNLAWGFYFIMIVATVLTAMSDSAQVQSISAFVLLVILAYSIYKTGASLVRGLRTS